MWSRESLKSKSKKSLKKNYARAIAACFIVVFFTAAFTTSMGFITRYDPGEDISENIVRVMGAQSTAISVTQLLASVKDAGNYDISELVDPEMLVRVADATLNPNSAFINGIKITNHMVLEGFSVSVFFLIIGFFLKVIYNIFFTCAVSIGEKRFFLENSAYKNTNIDRVLFLFRFRYFTHPALIMLARWIKVRLWFLTIVGGVIKRYEYIMIPYILAENPGIKMKDAFALSKKLMNGNKWNVFLLDLSFLGWHIMNFFTAGILNVFFVNPYKVGTFAELYLFLRKNALEEEPVLVDLFTDLNLSPDEKFVRENNHNYPYEKYIISPVDFKPLNAGRKYDWYTYILMFFIVAVIGWSFEVGMHLVGDGVFVNRGTLQGPWLPIFGSGGLFVLIFMRKHIERPILTFVIIATVCTAMEYVVGFILEANTGVRWWDYSEYAMNFEGRICLYGALLFGFGGCAILYYIGPRFDDIAQKWPRKIKFLICMILSLLFVIDLMYSYHNPNMGAGITDYNIK